MQLDHLAGGSFYPKGIKLKTFRRGYVISLCGDSSGKVWSRRAEGAGFDSFTTLFFPFSFFFFPLFCVVIFYTCTPK